MTRWLPYARISAQTPASAEHFLQHLRVAFDERSWIVVVRGNRFSIRRRLGWAKRPGLPVAHGTLESSACVTDVRIAVRLPWAVYLFGGLWLGVAGFVSLLAIAAALRDSSLTPLLTLVLPVAGWLLFLRSFVPEARSISERLELALLDSR
jgi:hypothetical protein